MATYRKHHITRWRSGWRYKRRVPKQMVALIGFTYWTKYLGAISEPEALIAARKFDVENDEYIGRLNAMPAGDRIEIARRGGLTAIKDEALALEQLLPGYDARHDGRVESDVDLDAPDAIEQIKAIRLGKKASEQLRSQITFRRKLSAPTSALSLSPALSNLIPVWQRVARPRNTKTVNKMHLYVRRFVDSAGDLEPDKYTRAHVIKFRDTLENQGQPRTNVQHHLYALHRLFGIAVSENLIQANPVSDVKIGKAVDAKFSEERRKEPFTGLQVKVILEASAKIEGRFAHDLCWIIRLLAYHGARSGEIVQLRPCDVLSVAGVPVLRITDEVGSLKNRFSKREIPIHPECMDIVTLAATMRDRPWLFMSLEKSKDKGARFQRMATPFLREVVGITNPALTMHSLRHTWRTVAREIDMPEAVSRAIMGHSLGRGDHAAYGAGPSLAKRAEWMARVDPLKA